MKNRIINSTTLLIFSLAAFAILLTLIVTGNIGEYYAQIITLACINTIVALGLNLITGYCGQLALGQAGFMYIGAYTTGLLLVKLNMPMFPAIILGGVVAAIFGIIIGFPTLRLRGDYLAITTLGFGEIVRVLVNYFRGLTGGASGLLNIPQYDNNDYINNGYLHFVWAFLFFIGVTILMSNIVKSSHGRAIISIREDEIASNSMGINVSYYKMFSFSMAAFLGGIGGGLYAIQVGNIYPKNIGFMTSVFFVVYVVFGGLGSITGTIMSTTALTILPEALRQYKAFSEIRLVIFGVLLILVMIFWPRGLMGTKEISFVNFTKRLFAGEYTPRKIGKRFLVLVHKIPLLKGNDANSAKKEEV